MALKSENKEIMGDTYVVTQFQATKALRVLTELGRFVGPSLGMLADIEDMKSLKEMKFPPDLISKAISALVDRADADSVEALIRDLASSTQVQVGSKDKLQNLPNIFEMHFAGSSLPNMFEWLKFALEVHFSDFFGYLAGRGRPESKDEALLQSLAG